jgi:hypothetical protein
MAEQLRDLLAGVPAETEAVLRSIVDGLAVELGESAEAWRGVDHLSHIVMGCLATGNEADVEPWNLLAMVGLLIAITVDHPLARIARARHA